MRDVYQQLQQAGITVIGISPDPLEALQRFRADYSLPFVLLSDPDRATARAFGAWGKGKSGVEGLLRSHFEVNEQGRVVLAEVNVKPEDTARVAVEWALA